MTNRLLLALSAEERQQLAAKLELTTLTPGETLLEPGKIEFVYFPLSGSVAKLVEMANGLKIGAGMIGSEGAIPLGCFFSCLDETPFPVEVLNAGIALRMTADDFRAAAQQNPTLHRVAMRFYTAFASQILHATACSRLHNILQQYCRWLLMTQDRIGTDVFELRQDVAGRMLGVRRMSVSLAAGQLKKQGLIEYRRGSVCILDRAGLEQASCECYRRTNDIYRAIMSGPAAGNGF